MSYTDKFVRKPTCFGKEYDDDDSECREECPFREECFEICEQETYLQEARKKPMSRQRHYSSGGQRSRRGRREPEVLVPEILFDDEVLPYEGEPWYNRLWWNMLSGMLSAAGLETHVFFKRYKFPPKPRRALPEHVCGGCDHHKDQQPPG